MKPINEVEFLENMGEGMNHELRKKAAMRRTFRGFHHSDIHKAAEELRMEGKGSHDPHYEDSKKNK